jgi:hypothetical protein
MPTRNSAADQKKLEDDKKLPVRVISGQIAVNKGQ